MDFHRAKIVACKAFDDYKLWIKFDDGLSGEVDLKKLVGKGVFVQWSSPETFKQVRIDTRTDTVCWGEDFDLDPYVLRDQLVSNHDKNTKSA